MTIKGRVKLPKNDNTKKVLIATPAYQGTYCAEYVKMLYKLLATRSETRFAFSDIDYADIAVCRNYLISNFYFNHADCSHILFIDSDMGSSPQLIFQMIALNEEVVGVIAPTRSIDLKALHANSALPFNEAYNKSLTFIGSPQEPHPNNPAFCRVDWIGTGILLISRECIDNMIKKCPDIIDTVHYKKMPFADLFQRFITPFDKIKTKTDHFSEDLSFCYRFREFCQGKIYAGVNFEVKHASKISLQGIFP